MDYKVEYCLHCMASLIDHYHKSGECQEHWTELLVKDRNAKPGCDWISGECVSALLGLASSHEYWTSALFALFCFFFITVHLTIILLIAETEFLLYYIVLCAFLIVMLFTECPGLWGSCTSARSRSRGISSDTAIEAVMVQGMKPYVLTVQIVSMWLDFENSTTTLSDLRPKIFLAQIRHCTAQIDIVVSSESVCTMNY